MSENEGVLFVPYKDTLGLLNVEDAMRLCEQVYAMHARGSVVLSNPPSFKLDVADGFHNHWHVKSVFLKDIPAGEVLSLTIPLALIAVVTLSAAAWLFRSRLE